MQTQLQGRKVLVKVGGETLKDPADRLRLARDCKAAVDAGAQLCLVHGAGPQITAMGQALGVQSVFKGGRRVTDAAMLRAVALAMCGEVSVDLLSAALAVGLRAVNLPAAAAGLVVGKKRPPKVVAGEAEPVDYGLVADVASTNPAVIQGLWQAGLVPLLSSLVADASGQLLNLNADSLVTALVPALGIDDVVLVTGVSGVYGQLDDPSTHLPELKDSDIAGLIANGTVTGGMVAKLEEVAAILKKGARQVSIVGYKDEGAIGAALTGGPGTRTVVRRSAA